jgi:hypothetical protein
VVTVFPSFFFAFSCGNAIYIGAQSFAAFAGHYPVPVENFLFPAVVVAMQLTAFIYKVGKTELEE